MKRFSLALLVGVLVLVLGCSEDDSVSTIACSSNLDCPVDQTCVSGVCKDKPDFNPSDGDIPSDGDDPTDGDEPFTGECREDADCDPGYVCDDNFCLPEGLTDGDLDGVDPDGDDPDGDDPDGDDPDGDGEDPDGDLEGKESDVPVGQPCVENSDCNDGLFCNGIELCGDDNRCIVGDSPCDDDIACTDDSCDEANNQCERIANHQRCDDRDPCNGPEYCDQVLGCQAGVPLNCDDEIACTDDSCEEGVGCKNLPVDANCSDGLDCTDGVCDLEAGGCVFVAHDERCGDTVGCTDDRCDLSEGCVHDPNNTLCDDGIGCTTNLCQAATGCTYPPDHSQCSAADLCDPDGFGADAATGCAPRPECANDGECDDEDYCNGPEACVNGFCQPGAPINCDDSVACTTDVCNEVAESCDHTPVNASCSDQNVCNGIETCVVGVGCAPGTPLNCNDSIECTEDSCDPVLGCIHSAVNAYCDDNIACTLDSCNKTTGCINAPDNTFCNDHVPCTVDTCNAQTGCEFTPNHDYCDDDIDCTSETCSPQFNCDYVMHNDQCDDGIDCTDDICENGVGCRFQPDDTACTDPQVCDFELGCVDPPDCDVDADCNDGDQCNGTESCVDGLCQSGVPLDCNDGVFCTVDSCSPANGCLHAPDHQVCDDDQVCTSDFCDLTYDCQHAVTKDDDNDYHIDDACTGGNDCDDNDPDVHPDRVEICDNGVDDDCDGNTDLVDDDCRPCDGECPAGKDCCDGQCVDILYNNTHCGGCDLPCGTACFKGECLPAGKCATALKNLITSNVSYSNRSTCGLGDTYNPTGGCSVSGTGQDQIYAIKPVAGNQMQVSMYPDGESVEYEALYFLTDCRDMNSCFDSQTSGNWNALEIESSTGDIFFAVTDFRQSQCGIYDFKVDYDYDGDCRQGGLIPFGGRFGALAGFITWLGLALMIWRRRRA